MDCLYWFFRSISLFVLYLFCTYICRCSFLFLGARNKNSGSYKLEGMCCVSGFSGMSTKCHIYIFIQARKGHLTGICSMSSTCNCITGNRSSASPVAKQNNDVDYFFRWKLHWKSCRYMNVWLGSVKSSWHLPCVLVDCLNSAPLHDWCRVRTEWPLSHNCKHG